MTNTPKCALHTHTSERHWKRCTIREKAAIYFLQVKVWDVPRGMLLATLKNPKPSFTKGDVVMPNTLPHTLNATYTNT